jgi:hypothetical protein
MLQNIKVVRVFMLLDLITIHSEFTYLLIFIKTLMNLAVRYTFSLKKDGKLLSS